MIYLIEITKKNYHELYIEYKDVFLIPCIENNKLNLIKLYRSLFILKKIDKKELTTFLIIKDIEEYIRDNFLYIQGICEFFNLTLISNSFLNYI